MTLEGDLANATAIVDFFIDTMVDLAVRFFQWPLVMIPGIAIGVLVFKKAKSVVKAK